MAQLHTHFLLYGFWAVWNVLFVSCVEDLGGLEALEVWGPGRSGGLGGLEASEAWRPARPGGLGDLEAWEAWRAGRPGRPWRPGGEEA